ncbi:MAG: quinone-interacting membrane-bound oxidoreductase complex subunit QmoC [Planctomycetota bacterium]|jgi:quinone-modifying oxidoreductase subunit QmoC
MPEACLIAPDNAFIQRVLSEGGGDLKKCFQCATCSVVCDLATGRKMFPRKEMIWAQWGLKDRLVADPDIWQCHQCNDCSVHCPRGARPADVLGALRQESIRHHALPRFLATWANGVKYLPFMLLISAVLLGLALILRDPLNAAVNYEAHHHALYAEFFPHWLLIAFFAFFTTLSFLAAVVGVVRFWRGMKAADSGEGGLAPSVGLLAAIVRTVKSILVHDRFGKCTSQKPRRLAHLAAFYGFLALFVVTLWAVVDIYVMPFFDVRTFYPFDLMHPMKILANVGCVLLIYGCVKAIADRRAALRGDGPVSTSFDVLFVWLLLLVALTGLVTEVLRFAVDADVASATAEAPASAGLKNTALASYFVHLVLVFQLLVYLPFSKFAHIVYRTVAMVYAEHSGRNEGEMVQA